MLMLKIVAFVAGAYLLVVFALFVAQRSLLYLPDTRPVERSDLAGSPLEPWPRGSEFRGLLADVPRAEYTLVLFHGNAGRAVDRSAYVAPLHRLSVRVLLAEYPGYGGRDGRPSEASLIADARATIRQAAAEFPDVPLYVAGESLGAGVAAAAVSGPGADLAEVDALLLITPWDSLVAVAARHYPFVPVRWLLQDRFDSIRHLRDERRPTVVLLAEQDRIVPATHGATLFDALPSPKARMVVPDAGHNDWLHRLGPDEWRRLLRELASSPR